MATLYFICQGGGSQWDAPHTLLVGTTLLPVRINARAEQGGYNGEEGVEGGTTNPLLLGGELAKVRETSLITLTHSFSVCHSHTHFISLPLSLTPPPLPFSPSHPSPLTPSLSPPLLIPSSPFSSLGTRDPIPVRPAAVARPPRRPLWKRQETRGAPASLAQRTHPRGIRCHPLHRLHRTPRVFRTSQRLPTAQRGA